MLCGGAGGALLVTLKGQYGTGALGGQYETGVLGCHYELSSLDVGGGGMFACCGGGEHAALPSVFTDEATGGPRQGWRAADCCPRVFAATVVSLLSYALAAIMEAVIAHT